MDPKTQVAQAQHLVAGPACRKAGFFIACGLLLWYITSHCIRQSKGVNGLTTRKRKKQRARFVRAHRYESGRKLHARTRGYTQAASKNCREQSALSIFQHKRLLAQAGLAILAFIVITLHTKIELGIIIITILIVHECGHLLALKWYGFKTHGIFVIPEFGAAVFLPLDVLQSRRKEAAVALAGPVMGCFGSFVAQCLYHLTSNKYLAGFAFTSAVINLLNLVPLLPLDGGRICRTLIFSWNKRAGNWYLCGSLLIALFALHRLIGLGLTLIMAVSNVAYFAWEAQADLVPMNRIDKIKVICGFVATCIGLVIMIAWSVWSVHDDALWMNKLLL